MKKSILFMLFVIGCSDVNVHGTVKHEITVNPDSIEKYFLSQCKKELGDVPLNELEDCTNIAVAEFMLAVLGK